MFEFSTNTPKENIKEFGNHYWYKKNIKSVLIIYFVYFSLFFIGQNLNLSEYTGNVLLALWAFPLLIMGMGSKTLSRYGFTILCFWYLPYLFNKYKKSQYE